MRTADLLPAKVMNGVGSSIAAAAIVLAAATSPPPANASPTSSGCNLGSGIEHVIYIQFDNTHLARDNPRVPSDLEQMPHLLNFLKSNGTLFSNDHTVLISHTAAGILSSMTSLYPDRHGQVVSNSNVRVSSTGTFSFPSSFGYWTDPVAAANTPTVPLMVGPDGITAPAPWVAFTRAGCNFGAVGSRQHRARKHRDWRDRRHHQGLRHGLAAMERGCRRKCRAGRNRGQSHRPDRFRRVRDSLRAERCTLRERAQRPPARRAGRILRISWDFLEPRKSTR